MKLTTTEVFENEFYFDELSNRITSSNFTGEFIGKDDAMLVIAEQSDFFWNRIIEESLQEALKSKGFTNVLLFSDYDDLTSLNESELKSYLLKSKCKYLLEVSAKTENVSYYPGGNNDVNKASFDVTIWKYGAQGSSKMIKMVNKTTADRSFGLGTEKSFEVFIKRMALAVAQETCNYTE